MVPLVSIAIISLEGVVEVVVPFSKREERENR